jgi:hypothetical protein
LALPLSVVTTTLTAFGVSALLRQSAVVRRVL